MHADAPTISRPTDAAAPVDAQLPPRVLVVDDDEANRDSLARRLQRRGVRVELAVDGQAALDAIANAAEPFDLVILDVMMPGMSGLEVLTRVRERHGAAELPIIMATARDTSEDVVEAFRLGASDYVTKPLDFAVVLARVQTQLALRKSVARVMALERYLSDRNADLERANEQLKKAAEQTDRDMALAARVQATYLPRDPNPRVAGVEFAWKYEPSTQLAGDALNFFAFGESVVGFYVLDVSGHGVAASLTAVAASRMMSEPGDPASILSENGEGIVARTPAEVLRQLNERFAFNADTGQFVTCFYGLFNSRTRELRYASAGHPGPILCAGQAQTVLETTGLPIGIGDGYEERSIVLSPGDRLFVYSDGIVESRSPAGEFYSIELFRELAGTMAGRSLAESVAAIDETLCDFRGGCSAGDDLTLLAMQCD